MKTKDSVSHCETYSNNNKRITKTICPLFACCKCFVTNLPKLSCSTKKKKKRNSISIHPTQILLLLHSYI